MIEPATYLFYIQLKQSRPSEGVWMPYDEAAEKTAIDDFHRLWNTNFLDNLFIDVTDYKFPNGTIGKIVTYNMEERQRVKIVDYVGSKKVEIHALIDHASVDRVDRIVEAGGRAEELAPRLPALEAAGVGEIIVDVGWDAGDPAHDYAVLRDGASGA